MTYQTNITVTNGVETRQPFTVIDLNRNVVNVTGYEFVGAVASSFENAETFPIEIDVVDEESGELVLIFPAETTNQLWEGRRYVFEVIARETAESEPFVLLRGIVTVRGSIASFED